MSTGQWIGQVRVKSTGQIVYKSKPTDYETAQRKAETYVHQLRAGDRFSALVIDRYAKEG